MRNSKLEYLGHLRNALKNHPDASEIYHEISCHIEDGIRDRMLTGKSEKLAIEEMLEIMGNPNELGNSFYLPRTSQKIKYLILLNWLFFVGGLVVTMISHHSELAFTQHIWNLLVLLSRPILFLYSIYWVYLGYSIGKLYGPNGKTLINKTLVKASIPNFVLMTVVLCQFIPADIFSPILNPLFILICVVATLLFYPISKVAFKFGIIHGL